MKSAVEIIENVCEALAANRPVEAEQILREHDPFIPIKKTKSNISCKNKVETFLRDGFVDRYSNERLIFPGTLLLISNKLSESFPYHPNWKMSECHMAYWKLYPTVDHIVPIARGGKNDETNWITTSQLRNSAKANWKIDELNWKKYRIEEINKWDGMTRWFLDLIDRDKSPLATPAMREWYNVAAKFRDHPLLANS